MTPQHGIGGGEPNEICVETLRKARQFALNHNAQNILITGKGEPTYFPAQVSQYLIEFKGYPFDKMELQTEGSNIAGSGPIDDFLKVWKMLGLDVIAISIYHYDPELNKKMFGVNHSYNLVNLIDKLHDMKFRVRLSCVLANGYIDSVGEVKNLIQYAKDRKVMQLSLRTIDIPVQPLNFGIANNASKYRLMADKYLVIVEYVREGNLCDVLPHGAEVYEVDGQNVCITTGLTADAGKDDIRQLIYFPQQGEDILTTSWENVEGGRIY
jgi:molybdenum cofactor biosynthesis enzyme MoaA